MLAFCILGLLALAAIFLSPYSSNNPLNFVNVSGEANQLKTPVAEPSATPTGGGPSSISVVQGMYTVAKEWQEFVSEGKYRLASAKDFNFPHSAWFPENWKGRRNRDLEAFVQQPFRNSSGNWNGLAVFVVDLTRIDSERFSIAIFTEPDRDRDQNIPQPIWLYKDRDLSRTQLAGDHEGLTLANYREDGSYTLCHIKFNKRKQNYECVDLSGKPLD
jgi:hypothetical protein